MNFTGKRALITGSSRGIGHAAAQVLIEAGATVAINGRNRNSTEAGIEALGGGERIVAAPGDVSTAAGCNEIVTSAADQMGGLDILVNSAGIAIMSPLEECTESMWDGLMDINLKGTFFCCRAAVPYLRSTGGNIVNVASDAALSGYSDFSIYCASKAGVVNMSRALALELAPEVRVNSICPGYVDTDMVRRELIDQANDPAAFEASLADSSPLKRIAEPWEIGKAIAYLASDDAVSITGSALSVDGGTTA